jgi:hypothetical protein
LRTLIFESEVLYTRFIGAPKSAKTVEKHVDRRSHHLTFRTCQLLHLRIDTIRAQRKMVVVGMAAGLIGRIPWIAKSFQTLLNSSTATL